MRTLAETLSSTGSRVRTRCSLISSASSMTRAPKPQLGQRRPFRSQRAWEVSTEPPDLIGNAAVPFSYLFILSIQEVTLVLLSVLSYLVVFICLMWCLMRSSWPWKSLLSCFMVLYVVIICVSLLCVSCYISCVVAHYALWCTIYTETSF